MVVGSVELLKIYVKTQLQWAYTLWKLCRAVTNMGFEAIYAIVFVYCESPRAAAQGEARRRAVVTRKKKLQFDQSWRNRFASRVRKCTEFRGF